MKLDGKVAIVNAAGRGIGRGIALAIGAEGANVVVNSYHRETAEKVVNEITSSGGKATAMPGDITKPDVIIKVIEDTVSKLGKVDIVVNNIGGRSMEPKHAGAGSLAQIEAIWDTTYEQNLKATVLMCEAIAPHFMKQKSGKIVNISSIAGRGVLSAELANYGVAPPAYSAMKAGVINYTQFLAERLGPYNVNVNSVCPGILYTDAWAGSSRIVVENNPKFKGQDPREWFLGIAEGKHPDLVPPTPLRREQTADDIGRAIVFLVSDDAANITGQALNVDGGQFKN